MLQRAVFAATLHYPFHDNRRQFFTYGFNHPAPFRQFASEFCGIWPRNNLGRHSLELLETNSRLEGLRKIIVMLMEKAKSEA
jgi:hypothetical protein